MTWWKIRYSLVLKNMERCKIWTLFGSTGPLLPIEQIFQHLQYTIHPSYVIVIVTVKLIIFLFQAGVGVGEKQGKGNQQKVKPPSEDEGDDQSDSSDDEDDEDGHRGALEG